MSKNYKLEMSGTVAIISLQTDFTLFYCSELVEDLDRLVEKKVRQVIFNFEKVTWLDSIAKICIAKAGRMANATGKKAVIINLNEKLKFILEEKEFQNYLIFQNTLEKAKQYFS